MSPPGFYHAPASKGLFGITLTTALLAAFIDKQGTVNLDSVSLFHGRLQRILTSQVVFGSTGELMFGLVLLYNFRQFEQQLGTLNFLKFVTASQIVSLVTQLIILTALPSAFSFKFASGPYTIIFALLVRYFATVPKLHRVSVLGAEFSEKSLYYLVSLQLLFSRGRESFLVGACGFLSGILCVSKIVPYEKIEFPKILMSFSTKYIFPVLKSESAARSAENRNSLYTRARGSNPVTANRGYQVDRLVGGPGFPFDHPFAGTAATGEQLEPPNEETVETLIGMGYPRDQVLEALRQNANDANRAAEQLLEGN